MIRNSPDSKEGILWLVILRHLPASFLSKLLGFSRYQTWIQYEVLAIPLSVQGQVQYSSTWVLCHSLEFLCFFGIEMEAAHYGKL